MIDQLQEQINVVAEARHRQQRAIDWKKALYADWEALNKRDLDEVSESTLYLLEVEDALRKLTLQAYAETGNKAPALGVGIRERTILTYDGKVAFDWAKAHKMALKLDTSAFEKIAKASPPEFVKITTEPQATIATNLEEKK